MFRLFKVPKTLFKATSRSLRILCWFIMGQLIQLLIQFVAMEFIYTQDEFPFCVASGLIVALALYSGMRIAIKESRDESMQHSQQNTNNH